MACLLMRRVLFSVAPLLLVFPVCAQVPGEIGPTAVGVMTVESKPVVDRTEFSGRIQSKERVALVARVTAFVEKIFFEDGMDVKKGDLLYRLERGPFQADVDMKKAMLAQQEALGENADLTLERAERLLSKDAGSQSAADNARAAQKSSAAQIATAKAQLLQSEINLGYTEIYSPIEGRIGRTSVTEGNVVGPASGVLATIVSQDPMYVVFPMSVRALEQLREKSANNGGLESVKISIRLPNGKIYKHTGKIDFVDTSVGKDTDSVILRAVIANPRLSAGEGRKSEGRELINDELVTVVIESTSSEKLPSIPRSTVMTDQQGDYVFVVNKENNVEERRIVRGASTPKTAAVVRGLNEGDVLILEGIQKVRPGAKVNASQVPSVSSEGK